MKKCSTCKCNKDFTHFINEGGRQFKTCNECRKKQKAERIENANKKENAEKAERIEKANKKENAEKAERIENANKKENAEKTEQINNENYHNYLLTHQRKWKRFYREFID